MPWNSFEFRWTAKKRWELAGWILALIAASMTFAFTFAHLVVKFIFEIIFAWSLNGK